MNLIYLDNNATTPIDPEVAEAMAECYRTGYANPASQHRAGRQARHVVEQAREGIALLLGATTFGTTADRLVFTSGGTEANNLALRGIAGRDPGSVIISAIEHPSTVGAAQELERQHFQIKRLPVDRNGVVDVPRLRTLLDDKTRVVSVMLANHETGVLQPVAELAAICNEARVSLHTDAVQAVGKVPVHFRDLGVAAMTVSAHKFHGPQGIGALLIRHDVTIQPIVYGGFQQFALRPGTQPVALIVGMHKALEVWQREATERKTRMTRLRQRLESRLLSAAPALVINGFHAPRLPHTTSVSFPGLDRQALVMALDLAGVACSTGSACASGSSEPSPVLSAMGLEPRVVEGSIRLSLGSLTTEEDIAEAAGRILRVSNNLQHSLASRKPLQTSRTRAIKSL